MVACAIHRWQKCRSGQPGLLQSPHILLRKQYRLQLLGRRPRGGRAAEKRDEFAPPDHSISSSALVLACLRKSYARIPTTLLGITASTIVKPSSAICTGSST